MVSLFLHLIKKTTNTENVLIYLHCSDSIERLLEYKKSHYKVLENDLVGTIPFKDWCLCLKIPHQ